MVAAGSDSYIFEDSHIELTLPTVAIQVFVEDIISNWKCPSSFHTDETRRPSEEEEGLKLSLHEVALQQKVE